MMERFDRRCALGRFVPLALLITVLPIRQLGWGGGEPATLGAVLVMVTVYVVAHLVVAVAAPKSDTPAARALIQFVFVIHVAGGAQAWIQEANGHYPALARQLRSGGIVG